MPYNGVVHNLRSSQPAPLGEDQGRRQSTTSGLLDVSRDEVAEVVLTSANCLSASGACYTA